MFEKCRRHQKLKYWFRTGAFVGSYCIIVLGIVLVLSRDVLYMVSGKLNKKSHVPLQYFPGKKRVCPFSSKVTLSNKVVPLFDKNMNIEPKLNLGFFAVCLGCLTRLLHA